MTFDNEEDNEEERNYQAQVGASSEDENYDTNNRESSALLSSSFDEDDDMDIQETNYLYGLTFLACLGGFLFGYDTGVVSGAMLLITNSFDMSKTAKSLAVSGTVGGCILGSLASAPMNNYLGRRPSVMISAFICFFAALIMCFAPTWQILCLGRIIVGFGIGIESATIPMYVAEVAPVRIRGKLTVLNNVFLTGGQFIAGVIAGAFSESDYGWRWMFGLGAVPALIQFIGFAIMPESPQWLLSKNKEERAQKNFRLLRGPHAVLKKESNEPIENVSTWTQLKMPHIYRALFVGCALQILQQLAGINTVMYYSGTIIQRAGVSNDTSVNVWLAAGVAFFNFAFTLVALFLVERLGRKSLLLASCVGVTLGLLMLSGSFFLGEYCSEEVNSSSLVNITSSCSAYATCFDCVEDLNCGFCFGGPVYHNITKPNFCIPKDTSAEEISRLACDEGLRSVCPNKYGWLSIIALASYLLFFAPGLGAMPWSINAEIYPVAFRGTGAGLSTSTNWISNLIVSFTFLFVLDLLTPKFAFVFYGSICVLGGILMYFILPETKGKTYDEIKHDFESGWIQVWKKQTRVHDI